MLIRVTIEPRGECIITGFPSTNMKIFLHNLIEKHNPHPAGKEVVAGLINAGEVGVAVEIMVENYYEHDVVLTTSEQTELKAIAEQLHLAGNYLEMINALPVAPSRSAQRRPS